VPWSSCIEQVSLLLFLSSLQAGIWPEQFGQAKRLAVKTVAISNQKLWSEYGLQEVEQAQYESGSEKFTATAYRLQDSTAALAHSIWRAPQDAKPSQLGQLAVETRPWPIDSRFAHAKLSAGF